MKSTRDWFWLPGIFFSCTKEDGTDFVMFFDQDELSEAIPVYDFLNTNFCIVTFRYMTTSYFASYGLNNSLKKVLWVDIRMRIQPQLHCWQEVVWWHLRRRQSLLHKLTCSYLLSFLLLSIYLSALLLHMSESFWNLWPPTTLVFS